MYIFNITEKKPLLKNADQSLSVEVFQDGSSNADVMDNTAPVENITGWALRWRLVEHLTNTVVVEKTTGHGIVIAGVYNVDPSLNTQYAVITLSAADMALDSELYDHGFWRTDSGHNTPLCKGTAVVVAAP